MSASQYCQDWYLLVIAVKSYSKSIGHDHLYPQYSFNQLLPVALARASDWSITVVAFTCQASTTQVQVSNFYMTDHTSQSAFPSVESARWWKPVGKKGWTCLACQDHRTHTREHLRRHERTEKHMSAVQHHHATQQGGFNEGGHGLDDAVKSIHDQSMLGVGLILDEMSTSMVDHLVVEDFVTSTDANSGEADNQFQQSLTEKSWTQIAAALSNFLGEDELSDEGGCGDKM
ncbi:hypothetical protein EDC04DRAFT_2976334 [Pisolithus marmoratus]|nr:hypothetical protein EDC04DRAFT_2976334 [Pisolithus marmoratus]